MIDEDLRTFMVAALAAGDATYAGTPIEKGRISQEQLPTRIYYQRSDANRDTLMDGTGLLFETMFDVEVASLDDATTQAIAEIVKDASAVGLNGFRGTMGGNFVQGCWVHDHSDQYEPKLLLADEGYSVASFQVQVIHESA